MVEKKQEKQKDKNAKDSCTDKLCPFHGSKGRRLKLRGRTFEGTVIRKHHGRVTIQFERMNYLQKYERYEKRRTKMHARLTDCMKDEVNIGDLIRVGETRPISKTIHFVVIKVTKKGKQEAEK